MSDKTAVSGDNGTQKKSFLKKAQGIGISTLLVMIGLMFSKATGFLRDAFVANNFSGVYRESFTLAFTIPDLFYNLLIGGSIQSAVTPSLSGWIAKGEEKKGMNVVSIFISVFAVIMFVVCTAGVIFSEPIFSSYEWITRLLEKAVGVNSGEATSSEIIYLASQAAKWLFPQIFFMMLAALSIGILNAYRRFSSTAFGPTVYNVFVLLAIIFFAGNSQTELMRCTAGVMGAAVIYFLFQYIIGFDKLKLIRFNFKPNDSEFIKLFKRALPVLISASIVQINLVVLNNFALLFNNSVSALRYASTIWQLPYGIFAVGVGNVMLPSLAGMFEKGDFKEASSFLTARLRTALFMTIPSAVFVFLFSDQLVAAIYQWSSSYTQDDASKAGTFLTGYAIAIITHTVVFIMNQAFYAIGNTKIPLLSGVISLILNPLTCIFLIRYIGMGAFALTLAYSFTSIVQMILLVVLYCRNKDLKVQNIGKFLLKASVSSVIPGVIAFLIFDNTYSLFAGKGKLIQLSVLAAFGIGFILIYFLLAYLFKMDESKFWIDKVLSKLGRKARKQN